MKEKETVHRMKSLNELLAEVGPELDSCDVDSSAAEREKKYREFLIRNIPFQMQGFFKHQEGYKDFINIRNESDLSAFENSGRLVISDHDCGNLELGWNKLKKRASLSGFPTADNYDCLADFSLQLSVELQTLYISNQEFPDFKENKLLVFKEDYYNALPVFLNSVIIGEAVLMLINDNFAFKITYLEGIDPENENMPAQTNKIPLTLKFGSLNLTLAQALEIQEGNIFHTGVPLHQGFSVFRDNVPVFDVKIENHQNRIAARILRRL